MMMNLSETSGAEAHYRLANVWRIAGRDRLAMKGYETALRLQPDHLPACLELTVLWVGLNRPEEALRVCRKSLQVLPENVLLRQRIEEIGRMIGSAVERRSGDVPLVEDCTGYLRRPALRKTWKARRVLFYTDCPGMDGAEQVAHLVMCDLARSGYEVFCAQAQAAHCLIKERNSLGIRHVWIPGETHYDHCVSPLPAAETSGAADVYEKIKPHLVFFSDGCPFSHLSAKSEAADRLIPFVVLNHGVDPAWREGYASHARTVAGVYGRAASVIAVSESNLNLLKADFAVPIPKGRVILNGRPDVFFAPADPQIRKRVLADLALPLDAVICMSVARLEGMKGYQYQLEAMRLLRERPVWRNLYFLWIGTGSLEVRLKSRAAELGVDSHVRFLGRRSDVPDMLAAADIFVLPSHFEGLPLAVIEAMARQVPVVASKVGGTPEALGSTGYLLPDPRRDASGLIKELAAAIERWSSDPALRRREGAACHARARSLFGADRMLAAYREVVAELLPLSERGRQASSSRNSVLKTQSRVMSRATDQSP